MRQPVRHQQGVEFGGFAIVEGEDEFSAIRAETLQRMRQARRKVPQIALLHVRNRWAPLLVYDRDAAVAVNTAHSACWCQWSSRTPPAPRRMFTPAIVVEIAKSS